MECFNTVITIETEFAKITKELKASDFEDYETSDAILREFCKIMVDAGWMPGSIKRSVIDLADEYKSSGIEIM